MKQIRFFMSCLIVSFSVLFVCQLSQAALTLTLSPTSGPPTTKITVKGTGFGASEMVDVYFDVEDLALTVTDASGNFSCILKVPKEALPGTHWVTAGGRKSGSAIQKSFTVRTNWSQFRYGPSHRGFNPYENVLSPTNVAGLNEAWSRTTGGEVTSSPAVVNGMVYVGSFDGKLYALNADKGTVKWSWSAPTGEYVTCSPAVVNGTVFFGATGPNKFFALNAATGALKWSATVGDAVGSSPTVANGTVYAPIMDGKLYAFDATTGALKWTYTFGVDISSPAVANGIVYVGCDDNKLYALNATNGFLKWSYTTGGKIRSSPAIANGIVYVGSEDYKLYALDAITGAKKWSFTAAAYVTSPAIANGIVYLASADQLLYALDAITGTKKWSYITGGPLSCPPAIANGVVYVGSMDGRILAFDASTGSYLWSAATRGHIWSSPAVADGRLYVGSSDRRLIAYSLDPELVNGKTIPRPDPRRLVPNYRLKPQVR